MYLNDWTIQDLKSNSFEGFFKISYLVDNFKSIPLARGVYMILRSDKLIEFIECGTGGLFNQRDPNVPLDILHSNWIEDSLVLYIGQAGGIKGGKLSNSTLRNRLSLYLRFGQGKPVAHQGGRYIWQIKGNKDLIVCWFKTSEFEDPCAIESNLIAEFKSMYARRPFANLNDGKRRENRT